MVDRNAHRRVTQMILGSDFDWIHAFKDRPAKVMGPSHRSILHDQSTNMVIAMQAASQGEDPLRAYMAAELHDLIDRESTKMKRRRRR